MDLRDYIRTLGKNWVFIALVLLLGVAGGAGIALAQTPTYASSAKVFVSTSAGQSVSELAQGNVFTVQRVKTYSDLATTPIVLLPVIGELELNRSVADLADSISVAPAADTTIIEIAVTDERPTTAAEIANAVAGSLAAAVERIEKPVGDGGDSPVLLTLVQQASVPSAPVSPQIPLLIGLGGLVGLAIGIAFVVLREQFDNRIRGERDVALVTESPIVGGIAFDPNAKRRPLIVHANPRSPRAESFRTLRTNLSFLDVGTEGRMFVITSSLENEGKSTTAANLAISLADAGARVLLVDGDLRRPKVAEYMGIEGASGLTDVLIGHARLLDVVQPWGRSKLSVLPAGRIPPNPSELLGSKAMSELIALFRREFDAVIFDAPPLLPVTDAAILARGVGAAIIVVAAGRTSRNQLRAAVATLENVGAPVSGVVLTMLSGKGAGTYGHGQYGYTSEYTSDPKETTEDAGFGGAPRRQPQG